MISSKSDLKFYFESNTGRLIDKWHHYFDVYEKHFKRFRGKEIVVLEVGVSQGGSLQMWRQYFGDKATIYGVDIDERCKQFEEENIHIFIGSQSDRKFLKDVKSKIPKIDILIDDGGHTMKQQIVTHEELFGHVKDKGVYLCEDTHTSYWLKWGGGYKRRNSFIEYSKNFVDQIHAYHSEQNSLKVSDFTKSVQSVHFYDSIVVIEKAEREAPVHSTTGEPSFVQSSEQSKIDKAKSRFFIIVNSILRFFRLPSIYWK